MDAMLGRPNVNVVEYVLNSRNATGSVDVKAEPRASKHGWRTSRHIMTLSPTGAQTSCSVKAGFSKSRLDASNSIYF